jgi:hypothetical protein
MRVTSLSGLSIGLMLLAQGAFAAEKPALFWNLLSSTVMTLQLAPAGGAVYGANQTVNDPDGDVEFDERLKLPGIEAGAYDVKVTLKDGRTCFAKGVKIVPGKVFSLDDKSVVDCAKG